MTVDTSKIDAWQKMQTLNGKGNGSGASGGGNTPRDGSVGLKEYVDIKIESVEQKLIGKLDLLPTKATFWGGIATLIATVLAVLAFAGGRFDAGINLSSQKAAQEKRDDQQDAEVKKINTKLDQIITAQQRAGPEPRHRGAHVAKRVLTTPSLIEARRA